MRISDCIHCSTFPCGDVLHDRYVVPDIEIDPQGVKVILISEASPQYLDDYYYAPGEPFFARTTINAFKDAGFSVDSTQDILELGVYMTTAVKCGKTAYNIQTATVLQCSHILEAELALFPNVQAYLLMGDVAIKAANMISKRKGLGRAIPAGPTYKIRGSKFYFLGQRAFPSYLQAGPSYFIEKSKRRMIAEDIASAIKLLRQQGN